MTNIHQCPLSGNNEQAPELIIGVEERLLSNDKQIAQSEARNDSPAAVESGNDFMKKTKKAVDAHNQAGWSVDKATCRQNPANVQVIESPS